MTKLFFPLNVLLAALGTLCLCSAATAETCPVVDDRTIDAAFADAEIRYAQGDPSGSCSWIFEHGASLMVHVQKRPSAAEAAALFQNYRSSVFAALTRAAASPKIGHKALMGMSPVGAPRSEAGLMVLDKDSLIVVSYYAGEEEEVDVPILASLERVGRSATSNKGGADQGFGQCEWLPTRDMDALLGKRKRTIQRLGPNHCVASTQPGNGVLMVMTDRNTSEESFGNIRESRQRNCTVTPLPDIGPDAYAVFDCNPRGNPVMNVELWRNGTHASVSLSAPGRAAVASDIEAMKPLLRHVFDRL